MGTRTTILSNGQTLELDAPRGLELGQFVTVIDSGRRCDAVIALISETLIEVRLQGRMIDTPYLFRHNGTFERFGFLP